MGGIKNGESLARAEQAFDVLVRMDGNIEFQQNYARLRLAIVALRARSNRLRDTDLLMPKVLALLPTLQPATVFVVE